MYLQITTKCNMSCAHCCYSCSMRGKHGTLDAVVGGIAFARERGEESISIGGGEPTLHPDFFKILGFCLTDFDYVWLATNGSQTDTMLRLANIIHMEDYPPCDCLEEYGEEEFDESGCVCHEKEDYDSIHQEDKLSVALSLDPFHSEINEEVEDLWRRWANVHKHSHFEIRDVQHAVIVQGRAKRTQTGWVDDDCVCPDVIIKPDGKLRLCGCTRSPVIGDVREGIEEKWEEVLDSDGFKETNCYKSM